jgi:hypothetical protein
MLDQQKAGAPVAATATIGGRVQLTGPLNLWAALSTGYGPPTYHPWMWL